MWIRVIKEAGQVNTDITMKQLDSINAIVPNAGQKWTAILPTQKLGRY
jgi:hypothetical protein